MTWQAPPPAPPPGWGMPPSGPPPQGPWPQGPPGLAPGQRPDRSVVVLVLSLSSLMVMMMACIACGPFALAGLALSIPAIVMARADLAAIDRGEMNRNGRDATHVALIIGIVSATMSALVGLAMIALAILYGGIIGAAVLAGG